MAYLPPPILNRRQRYLQVAFNSTLEDARDIIAELPASNRIIIEAGTPLIKRYGIGVVRDLYNWYEDRLLESEEELQPYVVADLKTMDRGSTEVAMAKQAGASAVVALGSAPAETLNAFIAECSRRGIDAMVDMMNVEYPLTVLSALKTWPPVVILHRGVDETEFNREKQIPYHEIQRLKGSRNVLIAIAGGDTPREVQRSIFNGADIAVVWKSVFNNTGGTIRLVEEFLKEIR
ncbi:orotidine 5'-phosphate decarboxylase [Candidatus Uhrbacteria bacterium]|nr:orotidine 5'-phosphate decarboxylase [Candidatus Uhrbacteria bacterium]